MSYIEAGLMPNVKKWPSRAGTGPGHSRSSRSRRKCWPHDAQQRTAHRLTRTHTASHVRTNETNRIRFPGWTHPPTSDLSLLVPSSLLSFPPSLPFPTTPHPTQPSSPLHLPPSEVMPPRPPSLPAMGRRERERGRERERYREKVIALLRFMR